MYVYCVCKLPALLAPNAPIPDTILSTHTLCALYIIKFSAVGHEFIHVVKCGICDTTT